MSLLAFKFIARLTAPAPTNVALASGDKVDTALNKLQGQINAVPAALVGKTIALDFGSAQYSGEKSFTFSDPAVTTTSVILMNASPSTANSAKGGDELEMDNFACSCYCTSNGTVTAYIVPARNSVVSGIRNFNYILV